MLKVATWNVNSLRVRLPHVLEWLTAFEPDILALQETKVPDPDFPVSELEDAGYRAVYAGQKTYNGVAILSRRPATDVEQDLPGMEDPSRRILAATIQDLRVINVYVPNGQSVDSEKYIYKLDWLEKLRAYVTGQLRSHALVALVGDFNIAPEERDVHDPKEWEGKVLFSEKEREAFRRLLEIGLHDTFRIHTGEPGGFTWWDYRLNAFRRNRGLRIDHILASGRLAASCTSCRVDVEPRKRERPSDHTPVVADFEV